MDFGPVRHATLFVCFPSVAPFQPTHPYPGYLSRRTVTGAVSTERAYERRRVARSTLASTRSEHLSPLCYLLTPSGISRTTVSDGYVWEGRGAGVRTILRNFHHVFNIYSLLFTDTEITEPSYIPMQSRSL